MPIAANSVAHEVLPQLDLQATSAISLLPTRATLIDRLAERTPISDVAPTALVLVGLLRRDNGWPTPGAHLDRVAAALSANVRGGDWLARSGPSEFAVVLDSPAHHAETAANRLLQVVADAGVPGLTACAGIAGLSPDAAPTEVHRRATLCLTAARSVGGGRVIRYSGARH
ncbi:diguanylate cyclase domain-containing protein [Modestobacter italicus]|uniref:diguanylate cyclase domain-containing protein n=1 Tax=Modestobacter italicus (strain DSM 44449 / CECT 9708 / BC 501) TaxID=2732864 RepID=UPI001C94A38A|nr:diguanylate cyclase [Modestobacter italicus]